MAIRGFHCSRIPCDAFFMDFTNVIGFFILFFTYSKAVCVLRFYILLHVFHVLLPIITRLYNIIVPGLIVMGIAQDKSSKQCHHLLSLKMISEIPT